MLVKSSHIQADTAASFTLTVEDYNDIPPEFVGSPYQFLTPEIPTASTTDMNVFTGVSSTDGDFSLANQDVRYELAVPRSTSTFGWLDIDSMVCYFSEADSIQYQLVSYQIFAMLQAKWTVPIKSMHAF